MRWLLLTMLCCLSIKVLPYCKGRYWKEAFNTTKYANIQFGESVDHNGDTIILLMDIYEPANDTLTERPLIIWIHGGSFIGGTKADVDVQTFAETFAGMGYVTASINYRLGGNFSGNPEQELVRAVIRATHDAKAAVRFFRKDAMGNGNTYGIDTNVIFIGGTSAGAVTALNAAFLSDTTEADSLLKAELQLLGGTEGYSGNPGYSSKVDGVINLAGAIGNVSYLKNDTGLYIVSVHATNDEIVPYGYGYIKDPFTMTPIREVHGSYLIHLKADSLGLPNTLYSLDTNVHPIHTIPNYMDTTIDFVKFFLVKQLDCWDSTEAGVAHPSSSQISLYPNPACSFVYIENVSWYSVSVIDMTGKMIITESDHEQNRIDLSGLKTGIYLVRIASDRGVYNEKIVIR